ncbi:hypothetical protein GCM10022219_06570 [Microbacterium oryzae]|uniref:Nucleotidyltransferase domain-containing protein n=1 Tax=Microbacterium oryzae TaxID=743009 RepID=A0A6I6E2P8_9MICO|nr:nucleotidyltransferase domain-containing protein [Microbacterium oryzae]QGU26760.1 nucleotidyltransferase domain-containing protein [Microbacterium oryzae]
MKERDVVERFLAAHFASAEIAVVGGSTARGTRTPTSDIDLLVIGDGLFADGRQSLAGGFAFDNEFFEVFAYISAGFSDWAERGVAQHRPVILHMLTEGVEIRGGERLEELRSTWQPILDRGPTADAHELAFRRYVITDLLDDLRDSTDALERQVTASLLFERTAELILLTLSRWIGAGKYLPRRLRELDADRADALSAPLLTGMFDAFADRVEAELVVAGGRVQSGFVR